MAGYIPTPEQLDEWRQMGRRTRREQGLPDHITDPVALRWAAEQWRRAGREAAA